MANDYRFLVEMPNTNGIPADSVTNTFYGRCLDDTDALDFAADIGNFYGLDALGGVAVSEYFAPELDRSSGVCSVTVYNMADVPPRVPVGVGNFTLQAASGAGLPAQVAVVMSFKENASSGANPARRRGRVYLGPLNVSSLTGEGDEIVVHPDFIDTIIEAAQANLLNSGNGVWRIYSPTDNAFFDVDSGWIDNRFDTQRRRLPKATSRTTFTAAIP